MIATHRDDSIIKNTNLKKHLQFGRCESVALLYSGVSLQEGSRCHPTCDPFYDDHFTTPRYKPTLSVLPHKVTTNTCNHVTSVTWHQSGDHSLSKKIWHFQFYLNHFQFHLAKHQLQINSKWSLSVLKSYWIFLIYISICVHYHVYSDHYYSLLLLQLYTNT